MNNCEQATFYKKYLQALPTFFFFCLCNSIAGNYALTFYKIYVAINGERKRMLFVWQISKRENVISLFIHFLCISSKEHLKSKWWINCMSYSSKTSERLISVFERMCLNHNKISELLLFYCKFLVKKENSKEFSIKNICLNKYLKNKH